MLPKAQFRELPGISSFYETSLVAQIRGTKSSSRQKFRKAIALSKRPIPEPHKAVTFEYHGDKPQDLAQAFEMTPGARLIVNGRIIKESPVPLYKESKVRHSQLKNLTQPMPAIKTNRRLPASEKGKISGPLSERENGDEKMWAHDPQKLPWNTQGDIRYNSIKDLVASNTKSIYDAHLPVTFAKKKAPNFGDSQSNVDKFNQSLLNIQKSTEKTKKK